MFNKKNQKKLVFYSIATLLAIFMLFTFVISSFIGKSSYADTINEEDLLESYLTNSDISEEYIELTDNIIEDKYEKYLNYDSEGHLYLDVESISIEDYDEAIIELINNNISVMNQLVDEEVAVINDCNELEIIDEEFAQQWAYWGYTLKWNKVCIRLDKDFALVLGFVFLIIDTALIGSNITSIASWIKNMDGNSRCSLISSLILEATTLLPADIGSGIVGYVTDSWMLSYLANILPYFLSVFTSTGVVMKIFSIVLSIFFPSIVDCVILIYNSLKYNKGVELKACWIPWFGDKWGLSLKSI